MEVASGCGRTNVDDVGDDVWKLPKSKSSATIVSKIKKKWRFWDFKEGSREWYSRNLGSVILTGQASRPYKKIGTHLERTDENRTSRDAQLPGLPMIALSDQYKLTLAISNLHWKYFTWRNAKYIYIFIKISTSVGPSNWRTISCCKYGIGDWRHSSIEDQF